MDKKAEVLDRLSRQFGIGAVHGGRAEFARELLLLLVAVEYGMDTVEPASPCHDVLSAIRFVEDLGLVPAYEGPDEGSGI